MAINQYNDQQYPMTPSTNCVSRHIVTPNISGSYTYAHTHASLVFGIIQIQQYNLKVSKNYWQLITLLSS